jgi:hypothetical protein
MRRLIERVYAVRQSNRRARNLPPSTSAGDSLDKPMYSGSMQVDLAQVSEDLGAKYDQVRARRFAGTPLAISVGLQPGLDVAGCRTPGSRLVGGAEANHLRTESTGKVA